MNNESQAISWVDRAISLWSSRDIKLKDGITLDKISHFEQLLDFRFPQDFIDLYSKGNGFEDCSWNEHMFSLWSLERIFREYQDAGDAGYIGICDYQINSYSIGFSKTDGFIHKYCGECEIIAEDFKGFIHLLNTNDDLLY